MNEAQYLQHLPEKALDALYDSLSVQTMPEGRYDGRAWMYGHPMLGWLASFVWRGKVFNGFRVQNRVFGMRLFKGWWSLYEKTWPPMGGREIIIDYPQLDLRDTVRQVSSTLYLGRMQWRRWTVHFTLEKT